MILVRCLLAAALVALPHGSALAAKPTQASLEVMSMPGSFSTVWLIGRVAFPDVPPACRGNMPGTMTLKRAGAVEQSGVTFYQAFYRGCGVAGKDLLVTGLPFGRHAFTLEFTGGDDLAASVSQEVFVDVAPDFEAPLADGSKVGVALAQGDLAGGFYCPGRRIAAASTPASPPPGTSLRGVLSYRFEGCHYECGFICPPGMPNYPLQRLLLEWPSAIPADASFVHWTTRPGDAEPSWQPLQATIEGRQATFVLRGRPGTSAMEGTIALASGAVTPAVNGLWWGGPQENGWGASIAQSGEQLFVTLYIYGADGSPRWVVMTGGRWDDAHRTFTGALFQPTGAPYAEYDATRLNVGAALGNATLRFTGRDQATLDYTLGAASGRKQLVRFPLSGRPMPVQRPESGIWWGGAAQNGWGVSITAYEETTFLVWYTYGADGSPTWFFASAAPPFKSFQPMTLYTARSSAWAGAVYDASRLQPAAVGSLRLTLENQDPDSGYIDYWVEGSNGRIPLKRLPF